MVFAWVGIGFLLAVAAVWLCAFPNASDAVAEKLDHGGRLLRVALRDASILCGELRSSLAQRAVRCACHLRTLARANLKLIAGAGVLLVLPALALLIAGNPDFPVLDLGVRRVNTQIANLLEGEHLVPPPALPPAVFATQDLALERPLLTSANRNWQLLDPDFARRLLLAFKIMQERHGYEMVLIEGYRTPQRQTMLVSLGPHVTNAAAFQSYHQFGLAADAAFMRAGRLVISERDPWALRGYRLYGEVAESVGLHWGGRWKIRDFGHVELRGRR